MFCLYDKCIEGRSSHGVEVKILNTLLRSLSDKYPWGRYEAPHLSPSYGLDSAITVLWHWITHETDMTLNKETERN